MEDTKKVLIDIEVINNASLRILAIKKELEALTIAQNNNKQSTEAEKIEYIKNANEIKALSAEIRSLNKEVQNSIKANRENTGYLNTLKATVSSLTSQYDRLTEAEMNSAKGKELKDKINSYNQSLRTGEENTDRYQRSVGNYAKANTRLSFSLAQVIRETPVAAMRMDMFFLAISNNIPMLSDEIKKTQMINAEMKARGEITTSVTKQLVKAFLSWNTLMMVGVTLLTMFGGKLIEWVGNLIKGKEKLNEFGQTVKQVNAENTKAIEETSKSSSKNIATFKILSDEWNKLGKNLDDKKKFIKDNKKAFDELGVSVENVKDAENLFVKNSNAFIKAEELKARVLYYRSKVQDLVAKQEALNEAKRLEYERIRKETGVDFTNQKYIDASNAYFANVANGNINLESQLTQTISTISSLQNKITNIYKEAGIEEIQKNENHKKYNDDLLEAEKANQEARIKSELEYQTEDFNIKQEYDSKLFQNDQDYEKKKIEERYKNKDITLKQKDLELDTLSKKELEFNNKQLKERDKYYKDIQEKIKDKEKQLLQLLSKNGEDQIQAIKDKWKLAADEYEATLPKPSVASMKAWAEWALKIGKYRTATNKAAQEEIDKYNNEQWDKETADRLEILNKQLVDTEGNLSAQWELKKAYYLKEIELNKDNATAQVKLQRQMLAEEKKYQNERVKAVIDWANQVNSLFSEVNNFTKAIEEDELQTYEEGNDTKKEKLQQRLDNGLISQDEYNKQVSVLDEDLDKKKAEIARKQAIREKLLSAMQITLNTATAIMKIWAEVPKFDFGVSTGVLTAFAASIGALQLATVLATPLPKASKGMLLSGASHAQGGIVIEAEGGEAIINKNSTRMFAPILSAINQAGGGVSFANTKYNDGGYAARRAVENGINADDIAQAVAKGINKLKIYTTVEDINRGQTNYTKIVDRGNY